MYKAFYGLTEKPFSILPDPDFLYWGRAHSMAFAMLEYGLINHAGFTVITGEIGCGKTTLIRHLLAKLETNITVGLVSNTRDNSGELLEWILMAFDQPFNTSSYTALYQEFRNFVVSEYNHGRRTVLIIDEAQNLGKETLEELRMFSNMNEGKEQLLQLILVGQPQLKDILQSPELIQFAQRVSSDFHLLPLLNTEIIQYIDHRLFVAGSKKTLFTEEACALIADASKGTPRVINILCDTALIYGFSSEASEITASIVRNVIRDKLEFGIFSTATTTDLQRSRPKRVWPER